MQKTGRRILAATAVSIVLLAVRGDAGYAIGQTCISDDGHTYAHGSMNRAGTHRCNDGVWNTVIVASPTLTDSTTTR